MIKNNKSKYSIEEIKLDALEYKTRFEWQKKSNLYYAAKYKGKEFLNECCVHMEKLKESWDKNKIQIEANKYVTRKEFEVNNPNCYAAARRNNILDKVCKKMKYQKNSYTKEDIICASKKYKYRVDFYRNSRGEYYAAKRLGIFDNITNHMQYKTSSTNYSSNGFLYYISIDNGTYYKIGITGNDVKTRFNNEKSSRIKIIFEEKFETLKEAKIKENKILKKYKSYIIKDKVLKKGSTEIFSFDVLGLDIT